MDDFKGKTVLVTGGSRGLGEAFCHKFAELGCRVFVNYAHGREAAEQVAADVGGIALPCDISSEESVKAMFEKIGGVDLLVNNARIDPYKRGADVSDGDWWDQVMSVNLKGAYLCGKFALEDMKKKAGDACFTSRRSGRTSRRTNGCSPMRRRNPPCTP